MSQSELELEAEPMTVGAAATLALGAPWRSVCAGCGRAFRELAPLAAVTVTRTLERRCAKLLRHPQDSLAHRRAKPGSWSAMEPAARVPAVLGAANSRLRDLLGEDVADPVPPAEGGAKLGPATLASLAENVRCLVRTIEAATTEDWDRVRPAHGGATAAEMVWLALHDATHHLEDAELVLDAALAGGPAAWAVADEPPGLAAKE